jgi:N utilization substance protein B
MGTTPDDVVSNFKKYYLPTDETLQHMNKKFFANLVSYFNEEVRFEEIITDALSDKTRVSTISCTTMCIIKVAILEMFFGKTLLPVIINEYVEIAKYFGDQKSVSFVNAILDRIAKGKFIVRLNDETGTQNNSPETGTQNNSPEN